MRGNEFSYRLQVIGRLRDGASIEQARAQMTQITAGLAAEPPRGVEDRVAPVEPLRDYFPRGVRTWMLMLARASARRRELVIRSALGASIFGSCECRSSGAGSSPIAIGREASP